MGNQQKVHHKTNIIEVGRVQNDLMHLYPIHSEGTAFRDPQSWKNIWSKVQSVGGVLLQLQVGCVKLRC